MLAYSSSLLNYNQFSNKGDLFVITLTASSSSGLYFLEIRLCSRYREKTVTLILMALDYMIFSFPYISSLRIQCICGDILVNSYFYIHNANLCRL